MLRSKDKFSDVFKLWLPWAESRENRLNCLQADSNGEFISVALKKFYNRKEIDIGYTVSYIHIENDIVKQY